ncbi:hypothetical protein ACWDU8_33650 [Streptomyces sp. NPDC003388]
MTGDRKLTDFRRWALAVLDLLSAGPERQVEYLRASGVGPDEVLLQFDDVLHVAHARLADGSLNDKDYFLLQTVNESVNSVSAGPEDIWAEDALEEAAEWEEVRAASRLAKSGLERSWSQESGD